MRSAVRQPVELGFGEGDFVGAVAVGHGLPEFVFIATG